MITQNIDTQTNKHTHAQSFFVRLFVCMTIFSYCFQFAHFNSQFIKHKRYKSFFRRRLLEWHWEKCAFEKIRWHLPEVGICRIISRAFPLITNNHKNHVMRDFFNSFDSKMHLQVGYNVDFAMYQKKLIWKKKKNKKIKRLLDAILFVCCWFVFSSF